jgi:hypothetical protein
VGPPPPPRAATAPAPAAASQRLLDLGGVCTLFDHVFNICAEASPLLLWVAHTLYMVCRTLLVCSFFALIARCAWDLPNLSRCCLGNVSMLCGYLYVCVYGIAVRLLL